MRKTILTTIVLLITATMSFAQSKTENFGVRGNCGMCKTTIEKAANSVDGVTKATWNKDTKKMEVSFDSKKTNIHAIHKAIAASGYDTDMVTANEKVYNGLPGCCQYDKAMKIGETPKKKTMSYCAGKSKSDKKSCH